MTTVFVAGSRRLGRLNDQIRERIRNLTSQNFRILVGDANGADKAIQMFLNETRYLDVLVYCSGNRCRNNIGGWEARKVPADSTLSGRDFYTQKDKAMAKDADFGLMIWDGKSTGTLSNVLALLNEHKKSLVYFSPTREFLKISNVEQVEDLIGKCDTDDVANIRKKISLNKRLDELGSASQGTLDF